MRADRSPRPTQRSLRTVVVLLLLLTTRARAQDTSALIGEALDKQPPGGKLQLGPTLPETINIIGNLTGVRIEVDPAVYEDLPWGEETTFNARFQNQTLRQALDALCQKLGLTYTLGREAVELRPQPPLQRIGRRSTLDELAALDLMASTPLNLDTTRPTAAHLLDAIDARLDAIKSPYSIENRGFGESNAKTEIAVPRNATLLDALEKIPQQTDVTWYPWGKTIVVLKKQDQVRLQLAKRMTTRFDRVDVNQVLIELAQRAGVTFSFEPGAIQRIPPQFRTVNLVLDNASVEQTLDSICGFTGLDYDVTDDGVKFVNAVAPAPDTPATTPPTTGPATVPSTTTTTTVSSTQPATRMTAR